jgi:AraC-like DNA-binding protein
VKYTMPSLAVRESVQVRDVARVIAARRQVGEPDLYDYLFATAATLREALAVSSQYLPLLIPSGRLQLVSETERDVTYSCSCPEADGRGAERALQFSLAVLSRAWACTGQPVVPTQVTTGASAATFSVRAGDLDLPMRAADPVLAAILRRYADSVTPAPATWQHRFQQQLSEMIGQGTPPSLAAVARRMLVSPRTLQRQLAGHGTTWRAELDTARRRHAERAGTSSVTRLARQLGYADARSARRALRRWNSPQIRP